MKFGLDQITRLSAALGNPHRSFHSVHIAGTNGKGSTTAMVETALRAAGHRTARYTSPHLERLEERFVMAGEEVSPAALMEAAETVRIVIERLREEGDLEAPPTFFEMATAIAFVLFRQARVDVAVLEVGLGGRLDATNIVTPVATAITSIDFDHQAQLGDTIESIAYEKAGIIKPGVPIVCGVVPWQAELVIRNVASSRHAPFVAAAPAGHVRAVTGDAPLALRGEHQVQNAGVALALLEMLDGRGLPVTREAAREGLTATVWPARLERFQYRGTDVLLDAAHNPAGARSLANFLAADGWTGATLILGAMQDKDIAGVAAPLLQVAGPVVCTTAPTPRALAAADLASRVRALDPDRDVHVVDRPEDALAHAVTLGTRVVAAGSIFLVGPLRGILRSR